MDDSQELLDLVDSSDKPIGTILRGEIKQLFQTSGQYVRYANCFIRNSEGLLWTPRRTAYKKIAPNGLDFAASEHVQAGEQYLAAAVRGMKEELGLSIKPAGLQEVGKLQPSAERPYFSMIYCYASDAVPSYNPDDFVEYEWLTPQQLLTRLKAGEAAKQDLRPALQALLAKS